MLAAQLRRRARAGTGTGTVQHGWGSALLLLEPVLPAAGGRPAALSLPSSLPSAAPGPIK